MDLIAAINKNWGIGAGNDLLYHIPQDMKFFKEKTIGNIIVVGRKTLESFPNGMPLKNRTNIVLTKNKLYNSNAAIICSSINELNDILKNNNSKDIYVCGGAQIYELLLPYCEHAYITKVDDDKNADKYLSNLDKSESWELIEQSESFSDSGFCFCFCVYKNKTPVPLTYNNLE